MQTLAELENNLFQIEKQRPCSATKNKPKRPKNFK
ncbi:hypothetical protein Vi05172_g9407 [Venturia inaequalis]|nr:hypothetical protein Vi05172_g9407 [Venturia inaequalis]